MGNTASEAATTANNFLQGLARMAMMRLTETPEDRAKRLGKRPAEVDEALTPKVTRRTPETPATKAYRGAETSNG